MKFNDSSNRINLRNNLKESTSFGIGNSSRVNNDSNNTFTNRDYISNSNTKGSNLKGVNIQPPNKINK